MTLVKQHKESMAFFFQTKFFWSILFTVEKKIIEIDKMMLVQS